MNVLAISYTLPPMLFPQAIQIGRLLSHSTNNIFAISGLDDDRSASATSLHLADRVQRRAVAFEGRAQGSLHRYALRLVPFYGAIPDPYRGWVEPACRAIGDFIAAGEVKPDLIVTFGDPMSDHLIGLQLKRQFGYPWLAHFSDPWSDNPFRNIQPLSKIVNRRLERQVIEAADATVFTSQETIDLVFRKYARSYRERAAVLPHAFDEAAYPSVDESPSDAVVMRYIGNFYGMRSPRPLFRALAYLARTEPSSLRDVMVELVGGIPPRMLRSAEFKALPTGLLRVKGTVSYQESLRLMRASDILLTIDAPARLSVFFPSKLVDYIGSGRRLVGLVPPGAAARIMKEYGGRSMPPNAPVGQIAEMLDEEIRAARAGKRRAADEPASKQPNRRYSIANVAPMFDAMCRAVAAGKVLTDQGIRSE